MSGHQSFFTNLNWIDWLFKNLKDGKLPRNVQSRMVNGEEMNLFLIINSFRMTSSKARLNPLLWLLMDG
jgi:hypothetical protein